MVDDVASSVGFEQKELKKIAPKVGTLDDFAPHITWMPRHSLVDRDP